GFELEQGSLPESRVHQRPGDRLLYPDRAGSSAAPSRSAADNETVSERGGCGILLRKKLPVASAEVGENGEGLERGQQSDHALLFGAGLADAGLGGESRRSRVTHLVSEKEGRGAANDDGIRSRSRSASGDRAMRPGGTRSEEHTSELQSLAYLVC